ncbi:hypothetical protein K504DRAFT_467799, partial [Pleomassaria siparia CBS 279.74]
LPPTTLEARLRTSVAWYSWLGFKRLIERVSKRQDGSVSLRVLLRTNRIVNLKPVVAYIAGTGSGKRLAAFLLPACCLGFERIVLDDFYYVLLPDYEYQMMHGLLTSWGNLRYEVKELRYSSTLSSIASYVRQQHRTWQKVLVYSFSAATSALLIATVGLVAGVDMLGISCILWFGGTGCGRRKGETCLARIVHGPRLPIFCSGFGDPTARRVIDQVSACDGCLRIPINAYLNGNLKRTACRFGEELCTFC